MGVPEVTGRKEKTMNEQLAAMMAKYNITQRTGGGGRSTVTLKESEGKIRVYHVILSNRQCTGPVERRLRDVVRNLGCSIRGWVDAGDGGYNVVAEER